MKEDVNDYVRANDLCKRDNSIHYRRFIELQPLEVPYRPWSSISRDWIIDLPKSNGYTQIWVVVDRFTKIAHIKPLLKRVNAKNIAKIFLKQIWKLNGLPTDIVSDRNTKLTLHFWQVLMDMLFFFL